MDPAALVTIFQQFSVPVALVVYFLYDRRMRDQAELADKARLTALVEKMHADHVDDVRKVNSEFASIVRVHVEVTAQLAAAMDRFSDTMHEVGRKGANGRAV